MKEKGIIKKSSKTVAKLAEKPLAPEFVGKSLASLDNYARTRSSMGSEFSTISGQFPMLNSSPLPYQYGCGTVTISDAIILCQKAWCRVPVFANAINTMAELANGDLFFTEGNAESNAFFEAWWKRVGGWKLKDQFFLELFRSSNVFFFRVDGKMTPEGAKKMKQLYAKAETVDIPLRYILLNPANIAVQGESLNFENPIYFRILNKFEIDLLKKSNNPEDKELYKNLPSALKSYFNGESAKPVPLDPEKIHAVFYKKQDYEPFAVPMGYPVLDSIELKLAMQKSDSILARSVEHIMLLVTMGAKREEGGVNLESLALLKQAFSSEEIGRVLVSDYTTKAEFVMPDLNKVLGAAKYEVVNEDIAQGLLNIVGGGSGEKFSNMMGKLKVFAEKLNNAQEIFINDFLLPEIKRISKLMGFKAYPKPNFVKVDLDDQTNVQRLYAQLMQLGILTPKDGLETIERGQLPDWETLYENQQAFKKDKDNGLFQPIAGGPALQLELADMTQKSAMKLADKTQEHTLEQKKVDQQHEVKTQKMSQEHEAKNPKPVAPQINVVSQPATSPTNGRPPGSKSPQTTKKVRPQGGKGNYSMAKLIDNTRLHSKLVDSVENHYKKINKVKHLDSMDKQNVASLVRSIVETEVPENWLEKAEQFVSEPVLPDQERVLEIETLAGEYGISSEAAGIVYHSVIEEIES